MQPDEYGVEESVTVLRPGENKNGCINLTIKTTVLVS